MGKRKLVPKAQHAEYTQYASLLRSLRTNNILDVTSHLTQYQSDLKGKQRARLDEGDLDDDYDLDEGSLSSSREASTVKSAPPKKKKSRHNQFSQVRDEWTRWPLLFKDVPAPDWGMEDEIEHLVNLLQAHDENLHLDGQESDSSDLDSLETIDRPSFLPELTLTATNLLQSTLAAIAHITPARAPSLQNRLEPIGWETVLD
ncbi:hypothetical protein L218DRAFT_821232, partial [Marasmius fiardii PR-910]